MNKSQLKTLLFVKKMTSVGLILGLIVFISSFFVSGIKHEYLLSIGISIMVSSMLIFGFGLFINLMEDVTNGSKGMKV